MGIAGLLPLLKEIQVHGEIKHFKGKTLAVDAYVWLHKGAFGCAEALVKGQKTTKFVDYAMHRVRMLKYHGITPFIVFDGGPLPAKKGTEVSRAKSRAENLARAQALEGQGQHRAAREFYTKCVDITPEMAYQFIKALRAENVQYIVAPYEADAQLCYLERNGFVDGIITEDSDLLVFGCRQVIFKLDNDGKCVWIHRDKLASVPSAPMHGWTETEFRRMAMLSGCDYLDSIQGIGIKKAHALMRRHKTVEKVLYNIRMDGAMRIPPNYVENFNQAELAFLHQRVFDPVERRLVPLHELPPQGLKGEDERWIGLDVEVDVARGIASGDLHPETREPIEDLWPHFNPGGLFKGSKSISALKETTKGNVTIGPLDGFIKRSKASKAVLPQPVGTTGSGSGIKSLSDLQRRRPPLSPSGSSSNIFARKPSKGSKFFAPPPVALEAEVKKQAEEMCWESSQAPDLPDGPIEEEEVMVAVEESAPNVESQAFSVASVAESQAGPSRPPVIETMRSPSPSPQRIKPQPVARKSTPTKATAAPFKVVLSSPIAVSSPVSSEAAIFSPPNLKRSRSPSPPRHIPSMDPISSPTPFQRPLQPTAHSGSDDAIPRSSSSVVSRIAESIYSQVSIIYPTSGQGPSSDGTFKITISSDSAEDDTLVTPSAPEGLLRRKSATTAKGKRSVSTPVVKRDTAVRASGLGKRSASDSVLPDRPGSVNKGKKRKAGPVQLPPLGSEDDAIHLTDPEEDDEEYLREKAKEEERAATAARVSMGWKEKYSFTSFSPSAGSPSLLGKRANSNPTPAPRSTGNENANVVPQWSVTKSTTAQPLSASIPQILAPRNLNSAAAMDTTFASTGSKKRPGVWENTTPRRAFSATIVPSSGLKSSRVPFSTPAPHTPAAAKIATEGGGSGGGGLGRFMFAGKVEYDPRRFG